MTPMISKDYMYLRQVAFNQCSVHAYSSVHAGCNVEEMYGYGQENDIISRFMFLPIIKIVYPEGTYQSSGPWLG